ncbi:uncharacterized protein LOC18435238 [Amborella trichopoda]|uniref:DUF538 domain-containing protein n=1 Tax=Amborella trichopoda TaxID=13333 RepID=W1PHB9_AMBTC|nr:uncharacterized protein LOC18435238 [Amborella trichopoda]ERN07026.1 hypothetical protein AMTR_s00141p00112420 [Amborella trichopoda]|eukprot:XP_006845351.1 uncharacterized protein LOC18435238 [Amborella trichopoda]
MASQATIQNIRENAEVYHGDGKCKEKSLELLRTLNLPEGLLPLEDLAEVGYNKEKGFVWLKQQKKKEHYFKKIGRLVSYAPEVSAFVEDRRMKNLTGVKSKELLLWISISEIYIDDSDSSKITFKSSAGLSRTFPVSAFELEGNK